MIQHFQRIAMNLIRVNQKEGEHILNAFSLILLGFGVLTGRAVYAYSGFIKDEPIYAAAAA
jgi:hypothetical protein